MLEIGSTTALAAGQPWSQQQPSSLSTAYSGRSWWSQYKHGTEGSGTPAQCILWSQPCSSRSRWDKFNSETAAGCPARAEC